MWKSVRTRAGMLMIFGLVATWPTTALSGDPSAARCDLHPDACWALKSLQPLPPVVEATKGTALCSDRFETRLDLHPDVYWALKPEVPSTPSQATAALDRVAAAQSTC